MIHFMAVCWSRVSTKLTRTSMTNSGRVAIVSVILVILAVANLWGENDAPYGALKAYLAVSPAIQANLGKIRRFHLVTLFDGTEGSANPGAEPPHRVATVGLVVLGEKGRGNLCASMRKYGQQWNVTSLELNGTTLLEDGSDGPDSACVNKVTNAIIPFAA